MRKVDRATLNRDKDSDEAARSGKESALEKISRLLTEYRVNAVLNANAQGMPEKMFFHSRGLLSTSSRRVIAVNPR